MTTSSSTTDDPTKTGYEVPTASTNYRFEVLGFAYNANSYGPAPQRDRRAARKAARRATRQAKQGGGDQPGPAEGGNDDQPPLDKMTAGREAVRHRVSDFGVASRPRRGI